MSNEFAAAALSPPRGGRREVGADDLTQGLMLVRASAIKVVRFQLAMERRDRRVALETVDDLVVLDRKIEDFLSDIPGSAESRSALELELEQQRQALVRERFTLAAGTAGRIAAGRADLGDQPARPAIAMAVDGGAEEFELTEPFDEIEEPRRGRGMSSRLLAAGLMLALLLAGLFVLVLLRPDLIGGLPLVEGVF